MLGRDGARLKAKPTQNAESQRMAMGVDMGLLKLHLSLWLS